jgi:hypothetical protein
MGIDRAEKGGVHLLTIASDLEGGAKVLRRLKMDGDGPAVPALTVNG